MENRTGLVALYAGLFVGLVALVPIMRFVYFFVTGSEEGRLLPLIAFLCLLIIALVLVLGGAILRAISRQSEVIRGLQAGHDKKQS